VVSLVPVIYTYFYELPGHALELVRGFFLGTLAFSLILLFSKNRNIHKSFLHICIGCVIVFFLRIDPDIYDLLGIGMIVLGALGVYLVARPGQ
jgi:predicted membrane channel-forming protein YqfA (hemolysin III family)